MGEIRYRANFTPKKSQHGLSKVSAADAFQIRSVARERFARRIGRASQDSLNLILDAIRVVVGIS
jgi:mRNA-degrading endonuclease toxin of MazEF toxin-antitoxin module